MFANVILPVVIIGGLLFIIIWLLKRLGSSFKKRPDEHTSIKTQKSTRELADDLRRVAGELDANIDKIQDDPLGNYGDTEEIAVVLSGKTGNLYGKLSGSSWAVQIYVKDAGDIRIVELVALSDRASAYYGGIDISASREKSAMIAKRLT